MRMIRRDSWLPAGIPASSEKSPTCLPSTALRSSGSTVFPTCPRSSRTAVRLPKMRPKRRARRRVRLSEWVLGEDSGLQVDALKGAPGIFSARYSGPAATDEANNAKFLRELADVPSERRTARYVCNVALADSAGTIRLQLEAACRGRITTDPRGTNGFGYDPYFLIPEYHRTFGELSPTVKRHLSHRGRAFERLLPGLVRLLKDGADAPK